jgi:hypothetical protein
VGPGRNNHVPLGPADGNAESSEPASRLRALVRVTLFTGKKISYRRRVAYNWALPARSHVHLTGLLLYLYCTATAMRSHVNPPPADQVGLGVPVAPHVWETEVRH